MRQRIALACASLLCAMLGTGCATTRQEAPPEVAPQPVEVTAAEAIAEGEAATAAPADQRAERSRPTQLSTAEIRERNAQAPMPLDFTERVDHAHDRIYTWGQRVVEATDRRFASKDKPLEPVPAAPFRLGTVLESINRPGGMKFDLDMDLDIALQLPNIERRLRIFITSDELDGANRAPDQDSSLRAGVRYELLRNLDFDLGIRVDIPPVVFAAVKWSHQVPMGEWDFYPLAKIFIETKESFGYALGTTFDRWSGRHLMRSTTYAKWRHDRDRTEWSQTFIYARAHELIVPDRYGSYPRADDIGRGWGVRLLAGGDHAREVSRYETGLFYRRRTRTHDWLYWHVEPMVSWERRYGWSTDPGIRLGIDALFWGLARPTN